MSLLPVRIAGTGSFLPGPPVTNERLEAILGPLTDAPQKVRSFVENLGTYNPRSKPAQVDINKARVEHWLKQGARPSDSVRTLLAKHLVRDLSAVPTPVAQ